MVLKQVFYKPTGMRYFSNFISQPGDEKSNAGQNGHELFKNKY
jgi:hypothetical protein